MHVPAQIAKQFRDLYFGGNWTAVNLKAELADVNLREATTSTEGFNSIATLVAHLHYYTGIVTRVLNGEPLSGKDADSFDLPPLNTEADWQALLNKVWQEGEKFAHRIEAFPEARLGDIFIHEKYGNYYRNFTGIIEHAHYHLGQIVLIKKRLRKQE